MICGTGVGISNAAGKVFGARAALVRDITTARYAKEKLNANVIGIGGKITGLHLLLSIVDNFLEAKYEETDENNKLIAKIMELEPETDHQTGDEHYFDEFLAK